MFDTLKVGKKIRSRRNELNMTQMELADKMGVSFQAVSNWERGASMPDIGKLSPLSEVLEIEIEELLGEDSAAKTIGKVIEEKEVETEELIEVAPVIPPQKLEKMVEDKKDSINIDNLVALAPYLDSDALFEILENLEIKDMNSLSSLAPYLDSDDLASIVEKSYDEKDISSLSSLAPFLESDKLASVIEKAIDGDNFNVKKALSLIVHLDSDESARVLRKVIKKCDFNDVVAFAPYLDSDDLGDIVIEAFKNKEITSDGIVALCPYLESDTIKELIKLSKK